MIGSVAITIYFPLYLPAEVLTTPLLISSTLSFNFRFKIGLASASENFPTPPAGIPGSDLIKLLRISWATSAAISAGLVNKTPDKKGDKTR